MFEDFSYVYLRKLIFLVLFFINIWVLKLIIYILLKLNMKRLEILILFVIGIVFFSGFEIDNLYYF